MSRARVYQLMAVTNLLQTWCYALNSSWFTAFSHQFLFALRSVFSRNSIASNFIDNCLELEGQWVGIGTLRNLGLEYCICQMASYADPVRGRVSIPWPMLQDMSASVIQEEMTEVVVAASGDFHPTKPQPGASSRRIQPQLCGFLLRDHQRVVQVDQTVIQEEINYLSQFAAIAWFVGLRPPASQLQCWVDQIQKHVQGQITVGWSLGNGFFVFKASTTEVMHPLSLPPWTMCLSKVDPWIQSKWCWRLQQ